MDRERTSSRGGAAQRSPGDAAWEHGYDDTTPKPSAAPRRIGYDPDLEGDVPAPPADIPPRDEQAELLEGLTDPQRAAVEHLDGPLLILAAAGSGKTRVITRRIAYLISCGVPPWAILAVTFTNKAAGEMRERVHSLLASHSSASRGLTVSTFHALCARLLRKYALNLSKVTSLREDFTIYDTDDQMTLLKKCIADVGVSTSNFPPRGVLSAISQAKNELKDAEDFALSAGDFYAKTIAKVYKAYQSGLRAANAVDFDDLLLLTARLLREDREVREACRERWRYLMIDEYQDTNQAQFQIASLMAGDGPEARSANICVVGDPDQSIYGWRGADIENILEFEKHYPGARVITLGENFRSTAPILSLADGLIKRNRVRKDKPLFTRKPGGDKPTVVLCRDERHEADLVVDWLRAMHESTGEGASVRAGVPWREMAIFYRTNALSRVMEEALRQANVPYTIARGTAFYEREEVRNALAYLRVVANPSDSVSLERVINTPARGIGDTSLDKVRAYAEARGEPLLAGLREASRVEGLSARAVNSINAFLGMIDHWTGNGSFMGAEVSGSLATLVERVIKESGLEKMYEAQARSSGSEADENRLDNLSELVSSARQFEMEFDPSGDPVFTGVPGDEKAPVDVRVPALLAMLRAYLESIALVADADAVDAAQGAVTMMTLHAAKGLEFSAVAMIGLEEGLLPHSRARESDAQLEEERRLCFVGITRAMKHLHMTAAKFRTIRGVPERSILSRFVDELPREHVVLSDQSDAGLPAGWGGESDDDDLDQRPAHERARPSAAGGVIPGLRGGGQPTGAPRADGAKPKVQFPVGSKVRHPQFGLGTVTSVTPGANARATIHFLGVGTKTLVLEFARLTPEK